MKRTRATILEEMSIVESWLFYKCRSSSLPGGAGFSLLEAIISVAVISILLGSTVYLTSADGLDPILQSDKAIAVNLAYEGLDATYSIRNQRWHAMDRTTSTHGVVRSDTGLWEYDGLADTIGKFTRTITIENVSRNALHNIDAGGSNDPQTRKVTVNVSWTNVRGQLDFYNLEATLNNWNSIRLTEDSLPEFSGVHTSTSYVSNSIRLTATLPTADQPIYQDGFLNAWSGSAVGGTYADTAYPRLTYNSSPSSILLNLVANSEYNFNHAVLDTTGYDALEWRMNTISPFSFGLYTDTNIDSFGDVTVANTVYGNILYPMATNTPELITRWPSINDLPYSSDPNVVFQAVTGNQTFSGADWGDYNYSVMFYLMPAKNTLTIDFAGAPSPRDISFITTGKITVKNYNGQLLRAVSGYPVLASTGIMTFNTNKNLTLNGLVYSDEYINSATVNSPYLITVNGGVVVDKLQAALLDRMNIVYNSSLDYPEPKYFTPHFAGTNFTITPLGTAAPNTVNLTSYLIDNAGAASWTTASIPLADLGVFEVADLTGFRIKDQSGVDVTPFLLDNVLLSGAIPGNLYPLVGTYQSQSHNSGAADNSFNFISWVEDNVGGAYDIKFQIRTSPNGSTWTNWCATDCSGSTWLTDPSGSETLDPSMTDGNSDQYMQYRVELSGDGADTPILDSVKLNYSG